MSTLGMCALFYSVTAESKTNLENTPEINKPSHIKVHRSQSSSPRLYTVMSNPRASFQQYVLGVHAKTKRSLAEEAESGNDLSVNSWIRDGVDPNETDQYGYFPLLNASTVGKYQSVKALVRNGADVNKPGPFGFSALHAAAQNGHREIVTYLLRNGADINAQNQDNDTPMHLALRAQRIEIVYQLLSSGGNSRINGFNNKTCIDCAEESRLVDLARILKNYSAFSDSRHSTHPAFNHSMSII